MRRGKREEWLCCPLPQTSLSSMQIFFIHALPSARGPRRRAAPRRLHEFHDAKHPPRCLHELRTAEQLMAVRASSAPPSSLLAICTP
ncbi:hypothetical protein PR202_gb26484 [Eleusine coracana subsp. coracana]|uniref:Uncharacterized protein n=1 Tax=Eleusine coracana subsp. coracana TaxID=191504 RepID=A0AAV5FTC9_ELECO|nr:hypothetical protein PR202_gb26484 [Eleusine coracana subsp. coracana]